MSVDSGMGNYAGDPDLAAIDKVEEGENFSFPGTNNVKSIIGSLRQKLAQDNPTNTDTNINRTERVDVTAGPRGQNPLDMAITDGGPELNEGFNTVMDNKVPTSLASASNPMGATPAVTAPQAPTMQSPTAPASVAMPGTAPMANETTTPAANAVMGSFNAIAYVIENGEVKCASCENYYIPESEAHVKSAHCGAPECHDAREEEEMKGAEGVMVAGKIEEGDVVDGDVIKTGDEETRLASTEDYLAAFEKTSSDSQLYYRGYEDAKSGKPLDEDLAELSDDYFHGYDQFKYYHIAPQGSAPQSLYDIKPNSNNNSRMTQGEADRGLNELTDGHSFATASNDNLKEALGNPLGFAHALEEATQIKHQRSRELAMNMAWMTPDEDEDAPKRPRFNPGKFTDTHQELPVGTLSSKLPFPTDVIKTFFED